MIVSTFIFLSTPILIFLTLITTIADSTRFSSRQLLPLGVTESQCSSYIVTDGAQSDLPTTIIIRKVQSFQPWIIMEWNNLNTTQVRYSESVHGFIKVDRPITKVQFQPHCIVIYILFQAGDVYAWLDLNYKLRIIGYGFLESTRVHLISTSNFPVELFQSARKLNARFFGHVIGNGLAESFKICTWCLEWRLDFANEDFTASESRNLHLRQVPILDKLSQSTRMNHCYDISVQATKAAKFSPTCQIVHYIIEQMGVKFNFTPIYYPPAHFPKGDVPSTDTRVNIDEVQRNIRTSEAETMLVIREESTKYIYCKNNKATGGETSSALFVLMSPFCTEVWIGLCITYGCYALTLWGLNKIRFNRMKQKLHVKVFDLFSQVFNLIGILLGQSTENVGRFCLLTFCASIVSVIILGFYSTVMISSLIVPNKQAIIKDLKDLVITNGYKIQAYSPKSAHWAPTYVWFADVFSSYGILDQINNSFNLNDSDCFPPTEMEELELLTNAKLPIAIGKVTDLALAHYLSRLEALYPNSDCYTVIEPTERKPRFWRFLFHGNEMFSEFVQSQAVYGLVAHWDALRLHLAKIETRSNSLVVSAIGNKEEAADGEPESLTLSTKIGSIFVIYVWLGFASICTIAIELIVCRITRGD